MGQSGTASACRPICHGWPYYGLGSEAQCRGSLGSWASFGLMVHLNRALGWPLIPSESGARIKSGVVIFLTWSQELSWPLVEQRWPQTPSDPLGPSELTPKGTVGCCEREESNATSRWLCASPVTHHSSLPMSVALLNWGCFGCVCRRGQRAHHGTHVRVTVLTLGTIPPFSPSLSSSLFSCLPCSSLLSLPLLLLITEAFSWVAMDPSALCTTHSRKRRMWGVGRTPMNMVKSTCLAQAQGEFRWLRGGYGVSNGQGSTRNDEDSIPGVGDLVTRLPGLSDLTTLVFSLCGGNAWLTFKCSACPWITEVTS